MPADNKNTLSLYGVQYGVGDYDSSFYADKDTEYTIAAKLAKITCECGQGSVSRVEDRVNILHSYWCPVYKAAESKHGKA